MNNLFRINKFVLWGISFKVSFLNGIKRIVVSKFNPYTKNMNNIDAYVTNSLSLNDKEVISHTSRRWKIKWSEPLKLDKIGDETKKIRIGPSL